MKNDTIFSLLLLLLSNEKMTAKEIASQLDISVRSVYRYVDTMTLCDIPVLTETGREGGIWIDSKFKLKANFFTQKEVDIITNSLYSCESEENKCETERILQKLKTIS